MWLWIKRITGRKAVEYAELGFSVAKNVEIQGAFTLRTVRE